jgi:hypothetical protein
MKMILELALIVGGDADENIPIETTQTESQELLVSQKLYALKNNFIGLNEEVIPAINI